MMKDLIEMALERARKSTGGDGERGTRRRSPAMDDALRELWESLEKKDFDRFSESFRNTVRIHSSEPDPED